MSTSTDMNNGVPLTHDRANDLDSSNSSDWGRPSRNDTDYNSTRDQDRNHTHFQNQQTNANSGDAHQRHGLPSDDTNGNGENSKNDKFDRNHERYGGNGYWNDYENSDSSQSTALSSKSSYSNYSSESKFPVAIVVPAIVGGLLLIALIVLICCCCRRRKLSRDQAVNAPSAPSTDDNLTKHENNKKVVSPSPNSQSAQNIIAYPELDHNYHNLPSNQQYLQQGHPYPIKGKGETNYVVHDYPEIVQPVQPQGQLYYGQPVQRYWK